MNLHESEVELNVQQPAPVVDPAQHIHSGRTRLRLSNNENAYGPSPRVRALLPSIITGANLARYADPSSSRLVQLLARRYGCTEQQVIIGAGSSELIELLSKVYGMGKHVVLGEPAFPWYRHVCKLLGIHVAGIPLQGTSEKDVDSLLAACRPDTSLMFITNPNNPTGSYLSKESLRHIIETLPAHAYLVIDEAYAEYADAPDFASALEFRAQRDRLIVLRTFSKAYGLAGARVGWGIAPEDIAANIRNARSPYSLNILGEMLACEALEDEVYIKECAKNNSIERDRLAVELSSLGFQVAPSQANFFLVDFSVSSKVAYDYMSRCGIETRLLLDSDQWLRISVGTEQDNNELITHLAAASWAKKRA